MNVYNKCLKEAKEKHEKGRLKLCPRGYCTAKHKFKVYPSAYANGYAVQVCDGMKPDLSKEYKKNKLKTKKDNKGIHRWFKENWVNVCLPKKNGKYQVCGRKKAHMSSKNYPYCRPEFRIDEGTPKTVGEIIEDEGKGAIRKLCKKKKKIETRHTRKSPHYLRTKITDKSKRKLDLQNACQGKTKSKKGLNIEELRKRLSTFLDKKEKVKLKKMTRKEISKLCVKIGIIKKRRH